MRNVLSAPVARLRVSCAWLLAVLVLGACSTIPPSNVKSNARLTPSSDVTRALTQLPEPKTRIPVAVYGFRDQTGQYRASPDSAYSTMVTQGAATLLVKALKDSGWYLPVEREGLQNLLTERRIVRAIEVPTDKGKPMVNLPNLIPASMIIEGGVTGYESNVRTGGKGANYLGIAADTQYRVDQVTVGLRSIDIRTGQVLNTVSVTKTIYSYQFSASVYKFIAYQKLLQGETGYTTNEPAQLAVREAIEAAIIHLTVQGIRDRVVELKNESDWGNPVIQAYLSEGVSNLDPQERGDDDPVPLNSPKAIAVPRPVQPLLSSDGEGVGQKSESGAPAPSGLNGGDRLPAEAARNTAVAAVDGGAVSPAVGNVPQPAAVAVAKSPAEADDIFRMYWKVKK